MANSPLLLDTHVLLWIVLQPSEISKPAQQKILQSQEQQGLFLSSISLWEIAMLHSKKRLSVYSPIKDFLHTIANIEGLCVKDISPEIAAESVSLAENFHGDPADRLIVATSRVLGATLVTRDQKILAWAKEGCLKTLKI